MATSAKVVFPVVVLAVCCVAMSRRVMLDYDDLQMTKGVPVSFPKLASLQVTIPVNSQVALQYSTAKTKYTENKR